MLLPLSMEKPVDGYDSTNVTFSDVKSTNSTVEEENIFLFRENEFEDDSFDDASFVAKYRRVITLESLREQLIAYNASVKKELYSIINRDYKDFITISTKLDGLDTRLEVIEKPLFDLQIEVSSLHNGVATSLRSIKDKLQQQNNISHQKGDLLRLMECVDNLAIAQGVIQSIQSQTSNKEPSRGNTWNRGNILRKAQSSHILLSTLLADGDLLNTSDNSLASLRTDAFNCSEYERAASALAIASANLSLLQLKSSAINDLAMKANVQDLATEVKRLSAVFTEKVKAYLENVLASVSTNSAATDKNVEIACKTLPENDLSRLVKSFQMRAFAHCVRSLVYLQKESLFIEIFSNTSILPYLKTNLTSGKVDGKEGRGSFSGLEESLLAFVSWIETTRLPEYIALIERDLLHLSQNTILPLTLFPQVPNDSSASKLDVLVLGLWKPVADIIKERFSNLFSIGITSIFSRSYTSILNFLQRLLVVVPGTTASNRLMNHPEVTSFLSMFKLDTYQLLRSREITQRIDKISDLSIKTLLLSNATTLTPSLKQSMEQLYASTSTASSSGAAEALSSVLSNNQAYKAASKVSFINQFFEAYMIELQVALHERVVLKPVFMKFVLLSEKLLLRLALQLSLSFSSLNSSSLTNTNAMHSSLFNSCLHKLGLSKAEYDNLRSSYLSQTAPVTSASFTKEKVTTDVTSNKAVVEASDSRQLTTDEQIILSADLMHFLDWLQIEFISKAVSDQFFATFSKSEFTLSALRAVTSTFDKVITLLRSILEYYFMSIFQLTIAECCKTLVNVKGITSKYRMTNKPAPVTSSPFVSTILGPFKKVIESYKDQLMVLTSRIDPKALLLSITDLPPSEDPLLCVKVYVIQAILVQYHEQVTSLLATVRQMDSALQRRAVKPRTGDAGATAATALSDSDKIILQLRLDIESFGEDINTSVGISSELLKIALPEFDKLYCEILSAQQNK